MILYQSVACENCKTLFKSCQQGISTLWIENQKKEDLTLAVGYFAVFLLRKVALPFFFHWVANVF